MNDATALTIMLVVVVLCIAVVLLGWHAMDVFSLVRAEPDVYLATESQHVYRLRVPLGWDCDLEDYGETGWQVTCEP